MAAKKLDQPFPPETSAQFANLYETVMDGWDRCTMIQDNMSADELVEIGRQNKHLGPALSAAVAAGWPLVEAAHILIFGFDKFSEAEFVAYVGHNQHSWLRHNWTTLAHYEPLQWFLQAESNSQREIGIRQFQRFFAPYGYKVDHRAGVRICELFGYTLVDTQGRKYTFHTRRAGRRNAT